MAALFIALLLLLEPQQKPLPRLVIAVEAGNAAEVRSLLHMGANPNSKNDEDRTILMIAAMNGHVEVVKAVLEFLAANVSAKVAKLPGGSQLDVAEAIWAVQRKNQVLSATDRDGKTALMLASEKGYTEVIQQLRMHGAEF